MDSAHKPANNFTQSFSLLFIFAPSTPAFHLGNLPVFDKKKLKDFSKNKQQTQLIV